MKGPPRRLTSTPP
ncbi:hypothetical protein AYX14_07146 [Cryptococcus neoformans]|nr:hypothetical protein AYX14_07146 [Cryptococcus neoformans var. grubii]